MTDTHTDPAAILAETIPSTPAYIYDLDACAGQARLLAGIDGLTALYSIKSLPLTPLLQVLTQILDGFSASSLNEARHIRTVAGESAHLHLTSPGLVPGEDADVAALCSTLACNSPGQLQRYQQLAGCEASIGLRINPELSCLDDARYDPCRPHSKLGVPLSSLSELPSGVSGIQVHNQHGARDFSCLRDTLEKLRRHPGMQWSRLDWINLGGGYLFESAEDLQPLQALVSELREAGCQRVMFEPGRAIVGRAGCLVTTVLDVFDSGGRPVVVLDSSVNHLPEVFEYQRPPHLQWPPQQPDAPVVELVGGTCKSGDVFGQYALSAIPRPGDRLVFADVGAYAQVKANRFNGLPMASVYTQQQGRIERWWQDDHEACRSMW